MGIFNRLFYLLAEYVQRSERIASLVLARPIDEGDRNRVTSRRIFGQARDQHRSPPSAQAAE